MSRTEADCLVSGRRLVSPRPTPSRRYEVRLRAERADEERPLNGGDAAILWVEYSPHPAEAGIAGRRFKALAPTYVDPWSLLMALCEAAFEGHHAAGSLNGPYLRSRAARIREGLHELAKREDDQEQRMTQRNKPLHGLDVSAFLRGIA